MERKIRLQRFLSEAGLGSRRSCEDLIRAGRVEVNGDVASLGAKVDPKKDCIKVDGERVKLPRQRVYLAMYKPRGVLVSSRDPKGRPIALRLLPPLPVRVHPVGRLDFNSEGLLIFTNDGELTRALTHPSSQVERVYEVKIQGDVHPSVPERLVKGVTLEDGPARASACVFLRKARTNVWLRVTMTEGRYREVRRMFAALGLNVLKLKRVRFGPVSLQRMRPGDVRLLTSTEVERIRRYIESRNGCSRPPPAGRKPRSKGQHPCSDGRE